MADRFAEETGTTVLITDYFHGDPISPNVSNIRELIPDWLKRHPVPEICDIVNKFISTIKGHYQSIQVKLKIFLNKTSNCLIIFV